MREGDFDVVRGDMRVKSTVEESGCHFPETTSARSSCGKGQFPRAQRTVEVERNVPRHLVFECRVARYEDQHDFETVAY